MLRLSVRALGAASFVLAAAYGCAKGTEGNIGTGGSGGFVHGSTMDMMSSPSAGGAGGVGGSTPSSSTTLSATSSSAGPGGATSSSTTASSTSSSSGSGGSCSGTHLLISQIKTRGAAGGNDEFVEVFNPTSSAVTFDTSWSLMVRSLTATSYASHWKGGSGSTNTIPAHGHFLITGSSYAGGPAGDDVLSSGIKDASSVLLQHSGTDVDAVCFGYAGSDTFDASFTCNGSPADNAPHDDTTAGSSDTDVSIVRKNGGCADTGDDASDFTSASPSTPHDHAN